MISKALPYTYPNVSTLPIKQENVSRFRGNKLTWKALSYLAKFTRAEAV